jgi:endoglucanase
MTIQGFLRRQGRHLVDDTGRPLHLRGVGLGNWLLPEGYMWRFPNDAPQSGRQIEAFFTDLVGPQRAAHFWTDFRDSFLTEKDIARIAAEGFDHVRLPLNARLLQDADGALLADGVALVDRLIDWCRRHELLVVLDLHGAPGGQTGTNIDDSPNGIPELFADERYWQLTVRLWRDLAARYVDDPTVAAYDLLNEPLPDEYQHRYADELVAMYQELTKAIREVDGNHLIMYEGSHWATNWSMFTEVWDENSALQFHKYWSPPDKASIQRFLDVGAALDLPIYMGEGGENNVDWITTAFQLYDDCGVSWNFWPWKKIDTVTSPCSVVPPDGWDTVVRRARGEDVDLSSEAAWAVLLELLDRLDIDACDYRLDVVNALFRRPPVRLPATAFTFDGAGRSYDAASSTGHPGFRHHDGPRIVSRAGAGEPDFSHTDGTPRGAEEELVVVLEPGDWVEYECSIDTSSELDLTVDTVDPQSGVSVAVDGGLGLAATAGRPVEMGALAAGVHRIRVVAHDVTTLRGMELAPSGQALRPSPE